MAGVSTTAVITDGSHSGLQLHLQLHLQLQQQLHRQLRLQPQLQRPHPVLTAALRGQHSQQRLRPALTAQITRESTSSFTSEGATQNIGVTSVTATYACKYTYSLVQLLPMIRQQLRESVSFRGRAQGINFWQRYLVCFQSPYLVPCGSRTFVCEGVEEYLISYFYWRSLSSRELFIPGASGIVKRALPEVGSLPRRLVPELYGGFGS